MKKKLLNQRGILLAFLGFLCVISVKAQTWTAPALTFSTLTTGTTYYVYNVGLGGYLTQGGNYGTQAVITLQSRANASTSVVKWTAANTTGSTWTLQLNLAGSNVANKYLFVPNATTDGTTFTDGTANNTWDVVQTDAINNIYSIQQVSTFSNYVSTQYLGSAAAVENSGKGNANTVRYNRASGDSYTQWKFVSQADMDLYNAKVLLDKYMNIAKTKGTDVTSYVATYNAGVTADINAAAASLLTALGRTDVTSSIVNPSFEDATYPLGWTNSGFGKVTNVPGQGWTKDGTNYTEKYTGSVGYLGAATITQTVTGLASGVYELVVSAHAVQQAGANPLHTGAFLTAGAQTTEVLAGQDYSISNIAVAGSTLTIGYSLITPTFCNWTGFDNFRLYYYGPIATPLITPSKSQFAFNGNDRYVSDLLTVSGANLTDVISITAPAGITVVPTSLAADATDATVTVTYDGTTTVSGNITFTSGATTTNVAVTGAPDTGCFTPLYSTGNLIADSYCNSYLTDGWGNKSINTDPAYVYCGAASGHINGGSIDRKLNGTNGNGQMVPNTTYRIKAMVYAISGTIRIGVWGYDGTLTADINHPVTSTNVWETVDFTFTTAATVKADQGIFFNNGNGYIDNWEMYEVSPATAVKTTNGLSKSNIYVKEDAIVADFELAQASDVDISVFNAQGMLLNKTTGSFNAGKNSKAINVNLATGIYLVRLAQNGKTFTAKVIK